MIGRAGRPQFDDCGIACVFVAEEKKNFYKKFLYEPFPVESSLAGQITDHINAEIASGTLQKFQHCIDYLTWTYFFRRLTKNPAFYGLKNDNNGQRASSGGNIADAINQYLKHLVTATLDKLIRAGCIEYQKDDQSLSPTTLGYLASFYYLSHETIKYLGERLGEKTPIDELIMILSNAKEFSGLPVRHNEDILNEALTHLVPISVPKHDLESPHVKSNLLLQAHFERCPLPITDYITDTKSVLD
jgi:activating signal cointegrator complex subunit 3